MNKYNYKMLCIKKSLIKQMAHQKSPVQYLFFRGPGCNFQGGRGLKFLEINIFRPNFRDTVHLSEGHIVNRYVIVLENMLSNSFNLGSIQPSIIRLV